MESLVLDLIEWLARKDRSYEETMDAWRTSCPKLTVWEDANDLGFVRVERTSVRVTDEGLAFLRRRRPQPASAPACTGVK